MRINEIAFATCNKLPTLTEDDRLVVKYLDQNGIRVRPLIWDSDDEWEYDPAGIVKRAKTGDFRVQEEYGGSSEAASPAKSLIEQAERIIDLFEDKLLYARVDGVEVDGRFCLMELELIEPLLFLGCDPLAPQRFAEEIASLCLV